VSYSVTDTAGHTTSASFDVTVDDLELPQITAAPTDIVLDSDLGVCGAIHTWLPIEATDNCEISSLVSSHASGDEFPIGLTTVSINGRRLRIPDPDRIPTEHRGLFRLRKL